MLLKLFQNWSGGFGVIPIFHFFEILKNFSFLGLSREPFGYVGVPGDKKVFTHDKKTFDVVYFDPPFLTMGGGVGKSVFFDYVELSGDSVEILAGGKKVTTHDNKTFF